MEQKDLAGKKHWDLVYSVYDGGASGWRPMSYDELSLERMLLNEIDRCRPKTVLEVGCGNSTWLPYLAKKRGLKVFGIDYSEEGCKLARDRLEAVNVKGIIFHKDIFSADATKIGRFDFVFSLGVVEHFTVLEDVIACLLKFVKPGGLLLTEVPNLFSIHGILSWIYQPAQLAKHKIITKGEMDSAYRNVFLENINSSYLGMSSFNIVAWGMNQRFPSADIVLLPIVRRIIFFSDFILTRLKIFRGIPFFSPFLYAVGTKRDEKND